MRMRTSHARLALYEKLDILKDRVAYFDTDSIIYIDDGSNSIRTGDMFGNLTDELSGDCTTEFVATGPKSYSFKYGNSKEKSAIKGFALNHKSKSILNHDSMCKIVRKELKDITLVNKSKITREGKDIVNRYCEKVFKFGYDKRVIKQVSDDHIDTIPYSF